MRCAIRSALLEPLNLVFLVLACVAGLASGWWYFPVGLAFYGWLVYRTARDPLVQVPACLRGRAPLAPAFEASFGQVERAQARLNTALYHAAPQVRRALLPVQRAFAEVMGAAYCLGRRATALAEGGRQAGAGIRAAGDAEDTPMTDARLQRAAALLSGLGSEVESILEQVARRPRFEKYVPGWVQALRLQRQQLAALADTLAEP